jgi:hypothetical protein
MFETDMDTAHLAELVEGQERVVEGQRPAVPEHSHMLGSETFS